MKKRAVITILGTIGGVFNKEIKKYEVKEDFPKSFYYSKKIFLKKEYYTNVFPLLIDTYSSGYEIVPIFTIASKEIQEQVLEKLEDKKKWVKVFENGVLIEDENNFKLLFQSIDKKLNQYNKVIIDVSHGFRHLPLLMLIDVLVQNIKYPEKIEKILFAKEEVKNKRYEIIDLKEYLDLANITYALSTFTKNYTISSTIKTSNDEYNKFLKEINDFSSHILANSLKELKNKAKSLSKKIDKLLNEEDELFEVFNLYLKEIKQHMDYIYDISLKEDYKRLYFFSKNMYEKGYLLNSITLLSEAIGMYIAFKIFSQDIEIKNYINEYKRSSKFKSYELSNKSKNILRHKKKFNGIYLWNKDRNLAKNITYKIKNKNFYKENDLKNLIIKVDSLRNNLAHGNSSEAIFDVSNKIGAYLNEFKELTRI